MTTDSAPRNSGRQRRLTALERNERDRNAHQLKISGATFDSIARALGFENASGALKAYRRHIAATTDPEDVEFHRELELSRLEDLRQAIYAQAVGDPGDQARGRAPTAPDLEAITRLLQIHDRKVRLLGLNRQPTIDPEDEIRRFAVERGMDPDLMVRQAEGIIAGNQKRWNQASR